MQVARTGLTLRSRRRNCDFAIFCEWSSDHAIGLISRKERPALARKKSWLRQRLNSRWLVWKAMRGLGRLWPAAARTLAFPIRAVPAVEIASDILENEIFGIFQPVTSDERRRVLEPAEANDTYRPGARRSNGEGQSLAHRQAATLTRCALLGHTFTLVDRNGDAVCPWPWTPNWNFARPALLRARRARPGPYLPLMGSSHYYHAYANDILPLWDYLERLHPAGEPLTVLVRPARTQADAASRAAIGAAFASISFEEVGSRERLEMTRTRFVFQLADNQEWIPLDGATIRRFAAAVRRHYRLPEARPAEKLFVSRGGARIRRLLNEREAISALTPHGFSAFVPEAGDHRAQVERFGSAKIIVAVHGAGLANLIFAAPGAQVIEIFPSNFIKSTFWWLSRRMGLAYRAVIGGAGDYDQAFAVETRAIEQELRRLEPPPGG